MRNTAHPQVVQKVADATADAVLKMFDPAVASATIDLKKTYDDRFVKQASAGK